MTDETIGPNDEERILATLAHAGIVLNGFNLLGIIGAVVILVSQRRHSAFVRRHALQALAFQMVGLLLTLLMLTFWIACLVIALIPALLRPELYSDGPPVPFWLALGAGLLILLFALVGVVYGLVGAWAAWRGRTFRYALLGALVERHANPTAPVALPQPIQERETGPLPETGAGDG